MKLMDMNIKDFLETLSSDSPTPGGGSISAFSGANAASLVMMVSALTTKRKKFKTIDESDQKHYLEVIDEFIKAKKEFIDFVDLDSEAFSEVMKAFKLPKDTEAEMEIRDNEIQKATILSIKVPMQVAILSLEMLRKFEFIIIHSNRNAISDLGVAVLLFHTAFNGALLNVKINLPGLSDKNIVKEYKNVIMEMTNEANYLKEKHLEEIDFLLE